MVLEGLAPLRFAEFEGGNEGCGRHGDACIRVPGGGVRVWCINGISFDDMANAVSMDATAGRIPAVGMADHRRFVRELQADLVCHLETPNEPNAVWRKAPTPAACSSSCSA